MGKITFYQVMNDEIIKSSCKILEKCYSNNLNTFVEVSDNDTKQMLNKNLWTFAQKSFIPHGSDEDPLPEAQPIFISNEPSCPINATCLMLIGKYRMDIENFDRVLVMIDGGNVKEVKNAESMSENFQNLGHEVEFYKQQNSGAWQKA
jgi:DNA polymerase-3 subunit chi